MSKDDRKDMVQHTLRSLVAQCPIGVYEHRKGGHYVVFSHTLDEVTLTALVHYYSISHGTRWTRTLVNFTEKVDGRPRFVRLRDADALEMAAARDEVPAPRRVT